MSNSISDAPTVLDLRRYKCPLPVLKARKAMYGADKGREFLVQVTDPKAPSDFADFCAVTGYALIEQVATADGHELRIQI